MEEKYEIKYYDFKKKRSEIVRTDSFVKFMILRLTKEIVYYKVSYENKYKDFIV